MINEVLLPVEHILTKFFCHKQRLEETIHVTGRTHVS